MPWYVLFVWLLELSTWFRLEQLLVSLLRHRRCHVPTFPIFSYLPLIQYPLTASILKLLCSYRYPASETPSENSVKVSSLYVSLYMRFPHSRGWSLLSLPLQLSELGWQSWLDFLFWCLSFLFSTYFSSKLRLPSLLDWRPS